MSRNLLFIFLFCSNLALAQTLVLRLRVSPNCYHFEGIDQIPRLTATLTNISTQQNYLGTLNKDGEFEFDSLSEGDYELSAGYPEPLNTDTLIHVNGQSTVIPICADSMFRPPSYDEIKGFELEAANDVQHSQLKLYRLMSDYPVSHRHLRRQTRILAEKYGVEYVTEPNSNPFVRQGFVVTRQCQAYNKIIGQCLDQRFGPAWRKTLK